MNWYLLYTASRAEKLVEQRLKAEGIETYLPLHLSPRRWSDRVALIELPLFSSYIFVRTTDEILRGLVRINGVSRIVFYDARPAIIKPTEIDSIKLFVENAKGKSCTFGLNDEVQIACGPLKNIDGTVTKVGKEYVILQLAQIGIFVSVKFNQVVKIAR